MAVHLAIRVEASAGFAVIQRAIEATEKYFGFTPTPDSGSTDCNVPLSLGIPSIMVSCGSGAGAHTREEYIDIDSQVPGLKVAFALILHYI
jgi:di/tripeptidase